MKSIFMERIVTSQKLFYAYLHDMHDSINFVGPASSINQKSRGDIEVFAIEMRGVNPWHIPTRKTLSGLACLRRTFPEKNR